MNKNFTKSKSNCTIAIVLFGLIMLFASLYPQSANAAAKKTTQEKYALRKDVVKSAIELLGATQTTSDINNIKDVKQTDSYYNDLAIALKADLIKSNKNQALRPTKKATNQYAANLFSKITGQTVQEILGDKKPKKVITKKQLSKLVKSIAPNVPSANTSKIAKGNVVINQPNITLSNVTVDGNLIIGDGVADKEVTLENVVVKGKTYIRGGGENSIIIKGSSELSTIIVKQLNYKVSLKIQDTTNVNLIQIMDGSNDVIIVGKAETIDIAASNISVTAKNSEIGTVTISGQKSSLQTIDKSKIGTIEIKANAQNTKIDAQSGSEIKVVTILAQNTQVTGEGNVKTINVKADNTIIKVPDSNVIIDKGISNTQTSEKKNETSSTNNSGSSSGSNSGNSNSGSNAGDNSNNNNNNDNNNNDNNNNDNSTTEIAIEAIYPKNGSVQVILNQAIELDMSAFYISCPTGKDMTILKSETVTGTDKNKIYNLSTAYYNDNTYVLTITLPNGKKVEKTFITNMNAPELTDITAERKDKNTATLSIVSDDAGIVYYMAVPVSQTTVRVKALANNAIVTTPPSSAQELKEKGIEKSLTSGLNTITIENLQEATAYHIYLATSKNTTDIPVMQKTAVINAQPNAEDDSEIQITSCSAPTKSQLKVVFNKPLNPPLDRSAFAVSCSKGEVHWGKVETADNQTYTIYMQDTYFLMSNVNYNIIVTFLDGIIITGKCYTDFQWPTITAFEVKRISESTISVSFNSDEPGKLSYIISDTALTSSKDVLDNPNVQVRELSAGINKFNIENVNVSEKSDLYFCMVATDNSGNTASYVEKKLIPEQITP